GADLGHEVVVVRVEPLGHLERGQLPGSAGEGEVAGQVERAVLLPEVREARGHRAKGDGGVEHLIVEGEVAGDGGVVRGQAELEESCALATAQLVGGGLQVVELAASRPEGLDRPLELAVGPDPGVPEDRGGGQLGGGAVGHRDVLVVEVVKGRRSRSTTSSAGRCLLQVDGCRPGAPAATTSSTSWIVVSIPTRWRSSSSVAARSRSSRAGGAGTPVSSARQVSRRGSVIGMTPATSGRQTPAARALATSPR